jgi:histone H3/H4
METKPQQRRAAKPKKQTVVITTPIGPTTSNDAISEAVAAVVNNALDEVNTTVATNGTAPADTHVDPAARGTRTQTNKAIGINISAARVRRWLDKLTLNKAIDEEIAKYKTKIVAYESADSMLAYGQVKRVTQQEVDGKLKNIITVGPITAAEKLTAEKTVAEIKPQIADLKERVNALSRERTRFSNESSIVLAIICDEIIKQLVEHTMKRVLLAKKKIIQVEHLHEVGVTDLPLYPLIKSLPIFAEKAAKIAKITNDELQKVSIANAVALAEKEFRKKYNVHLPKKKPAIVTVVADTTTPIDGQPNAAAAEHNGTNGTTGTNGVNGSVPVPTDVLDAGHEDDTGDSKTTFKFYVHLACKDIQESNPNYISIRISTEIRNYLSELLIQFIQRIAPLVLLTAANMKNKTINDEAILRTVEALLIDGHGADEHISLTPAKLPSKEAVKAAFAKRDEVKKADPNAVYEIDIKAMPQVDGYYAQKTINYPTSKFEALASKVNQRLTIYKSLSTKEKNGLVHDGEVAEVAAH